MPRKSSIKTLPAAILARLNFMLGEDVLTLDEIVAWLDERGHKRSRTAVHRYKQNEKTLKMRLRQSREITEAVARELGDAATQGKQGRLLVEMARTLVFDLLMRLQAAEDGDTVKGGIDPRDAAYLGKALAELGRALRYDQDFEQKIRDEAAKEMAAKIDEAGKAAASKGLSKETADFIRDQVLGVRA